MNVSSTSETRAAILLVAWETRRGLETGRSNDQGVLDTLMPSTDTMPTRCKSVALDANTFAARVRVRCDRNMSMIFLNMLEKVAVVCRPNQFHTRCQSVPHNYVAGDHWHSLQDCKTAMFVLGTHCRLLPRSPMCDSPISSKRFWQNRSCNCVCDHCKLF